MIHKLWTFLDLVQEAFTINVGDKQVLVTKYGFGDNRLA